ncbi:unnamed protein product [Dovyalis caffra]|uniref:MADS-box domain-containing protein n=1 Tax=Dovyalis caffra TaxID=77055 RepID=A0AAV1SQ87_9ROSI|nr:unnamed protein product [Dovyalis caffra]
MAKRETSEQRAVTFTKRRHGLFNKAADLCRICDAQIAIMVTSTGSKEKVYTFGHSSVDAVFDRFLNNFSALPEAAANDAGIKSASNSIYEEIKALEGDVNALMQNKKRRVEGISWDYIEELVQSSTSVQELEDAVESLESLLGHAKNKLMNNSTGNLGISNIVERKSDDFLALELEPHDDSSLTFELKHRDDSFSSLDEEIYFDGCWSTTDGSPSNNGVYFPGEVDMDDIWNLLESSDFGSDSHNVISNNNSNDCATSRTVSESASGSLENGGNVFPATNLDLETFKNKKLVDSVTYNATPDSDFGDTNQHYVMDGDCNAKQLDSATDYGFMDFFGEFGNCMTDQMRLPLLISRS